MDKQLEQINERLDAIEKALRELREEMGGFHEEVYQIGTATLPLNSTMTTNLWD